MTAFLIVVAVVVALVLWHNTRRLREIRRAEFIHDYKFPQGLLDKLAQKHPTLRGKDLHLVTRGLRQFFTAYLKGGRRPVSMPSQVVDDLWHEFILYTRNYEAFCRQAFGQFMHHTPAKALGPERQSNEGLRRVWWQCCRDENIHPRRPSRLPLLFALDAKLAIAGGFHYTTDCSQWASRRRDDGAVAAGGVPYCAGDFSSDSFDGGTAGFGDGSHDGSSSSSSSQGSDGGGGGDGGGSSCGGGGCSS